MRCLSLLFITLILVSFSVYAYGDGDDGTCFPAWTDVTMSDNSTKKIVDIKPGDLVLSYDTEINRYLEKEVVWFDDRHTVGDHRENCKKLV